MGPPALVVAGSNRRSTRASSEELPEVQHFPRRFPRIATAFQCKIPSDAVMSDYETSRQPPDIMSEDFPYRTAIEIDEKIEATVNSTTTKAITPACEIIGKTPMRMRGDSPCLNKLSYDVSEAFESNIRDEMCALATANTSKQHSCLPDDSSPCNPVYARFLGLCGPLSPLSLISISVAC